MLQDGAIKTIYLWMTVQLLIQQIPGLPTGKYPITVNGSLDVTGSKMYNGIWCTADVKQKTETF